MSTSQVQRQAAPAGDALPLRSLTAVWVLLGALGVGLVGLGVRSAAPAKAPIRAEAASAQGPSKEQLRQRQEHIAITQRALELAQKERKAAAPGAAPAPAGPSSAGPAEPAPPASDARPAVSAAAPAAVAPKATPTSPVAEKTPADTAEPAPAPAKPAAKSGLDAMRDDIAADFE